MNDATFGDFAREPCLKNFNFKIGQGFKYFILWQLFFSGGEEHGMCGAVRLERRRTC